MKKIVLSVLAIVTVACAGMQKPDPKDAKAVLDAAVQACAFREALPKEAKPVCEKLDDAQRATRDAQRATRDAAKAVLEAVPEVK